MRGTKNFLDFLFFRCIGLSEAARNGEVQKRETERERERERAHKRESAQEREEREHEELMEARPRRGQREIEGGTTLISVPLTSAKL